jgi:hypothetical protein
MKMPALLFLVEGRGMKQNGKRSATNLQIICNGTAVETPVTIDYHYAQHTQRKGFLRARFKTP